MPYALMLYSKREQNVSQLTSSPQTCWVLTWRGHCVSVPDKSFLLSVCPTNPDCHHSVYLSNVSVSHRLSAACCLCLSIVTLPTTKSLHSLQVTSQRPELYISFHFSYSHYLCLWPDGYTQHAPHGWFLKAQCSQNIIFLCFIYSTLHTYWDSEAFLSYFGSILQKFRFEIQQCADCRL